ncbi:MAG: hypothetical protein K9G46_12325 [Flavobacteriales bacterium]|jgi:hypothetical protein|nr:hypothetical protein [Flavobacteriales bacterium]
MDEFLTEESVILKQKNKPRWFLIIGSALLFASSYLILYILYDFATAVTAAHFGLKPILFFDTISFDNNDAWYPRCVKITFTIGAFVMATTGIGFYLLYLTLKKTALALRLTFIWLSLVSFIILAQRMLGILFARNFQFRDLDSKGMELAIFTAYDYWKGAGETGLAMIGILICLVTSVLFSKPFLQTASSIYQIDTPDYRKKFVIYYIVTPALVGAGMITVFTFPKNLVPNFLFFGCLAISLMSISFASMKSRLLIRRQPELKSNWPLVAATAFLIIVVLARTVLDNGIPIPDTGIGHFLF